MLIDKRTSDVLSLSEFYGLYNANKETLHITKVNDGTHFINIKAKPKEGIVGVKGNTDICPVGYDTVGILYKMPNEKNQDYSKRIRAGYIEALSNIAI